MGCLRLNTLQEQASQGLRLEFTQAVQSGRLLLEQTLLLRVLNELAPNLTSIGRVDVLKVIANDREPPFSGLLGREADGLHCLEQGVARRWIFH